MKMSERLTIGLLAAAVSGCHVVTSTHPVGYRLEAEAAGDLAVNRNDWEGTWVNSAGGAATVKVLDPEKGIFRVAWVEEEPGEPTLHVREAHLRVWRGWLFGSLQADTEDRPSEVRYLWGRVKMEHGQLLLWTPSEEKLKRLVEDGTLPGSVDADDVHLGELTQEHLVILTSDERGVLFEWDSPAVFWRIGR